MTTQSLEEKLIEEFDNSFVQYEEGVTDWLKEAFEKVAKQEYERGAREEGEKFEVGVSKLILEHPELDVAIKSVLYFNQLNQDKT